MHRIAKIRISHLNEQIICGLCFGYLVDAATIVECLHSFCRSCLVQYLTDSNTCPLCCQLIHKTKPLVNIRSDKTLQNLVYKLVPGLFKSEMERRRNFYSQHPEAGLSNSFYSKVSEHVPDVSSPNAREERGDIYEDPWLTSNNETDLISISLQYSALFPKTHHKEPKPNDKRYLLCPSYITVAVLKKFIRCKFDLPNHFHIELYYSDECLDDSYSVMDIASLYTWRRTEPLQLFYFFFDSSPSAILTLQQKSILSVTLSNSGLISDEKVVKSEQLKKRKRKVEHSWCLKPIKTFRIRDLDKIETCAYDATLSSNLLSSTSATGICDEALHLDRGLCGTKSLATSTSDANSINAKKAQSLESSADNDSGDNSSSGIDNKDNGSVDNDGGLEETTVNRTLTVEGICPLRLLRLSPKPKPQPTRFESEGVSNSRQLNEHHSGTISSSSRSVHDPSHKVRDAGGNCRSSSCHQPKQSSSASTSSIKAPSATEPRSIWSVLPSPRIRIQEGKSSTTSEGSVTAGKGSPGNVSSQRVSHAGYHRPSCHSRSSISIYEDPHPSKSTNLSTSTTVSTSTNLSTSTNVSTPTTVSTSTILPTPTAKVGIVICRGRAMPLQDKHLHLASTIPTPPLPPPPIPPIAHSCSLAVSSSSDARRPASVKRLLQIQAESENLTAATKKRRLSDQDRLPLTSAPSLFLASYLRTLGAFAHTATAKQKVARVFRDRNALASLSPPSSKLSPAVGPLSPLPQAQSVCRPLKPRRQMMNVKTVNRTRPDACNSISCVDESNAAAAAKGLVLADDRRGIRGIEHPLELTTIK